MALAWRVCQVQRRGRRALRRIQPLRHLAQPDEEGGEHEVRAAPQRTQPGGALAHPRPALAPARLCHAAGAFSNRGQRHVVERFQREAELHRERDGQIPVCL